MTRLEAAVADVTALLDESRHSHMIIGGFAVLYWGGTVIVRRGSELDRDYLDPKVRELATDLDRPDIETFYRSCLAVAGHFPTPNAGEPRDG